MSDQEKNDNNGVAHHKDDTLLDLPPDPDAHLSEAERAEIVSTSSNLR
jgi:hypothetical protein